MKVAIFHPSLVLKGGSERVVLEFLKNTKHDVDVYTYNFDEATTFKDFIKFRNKIYIVGPKIIKKILKWKYIRAFILPFFTKIPLNKYNIFIISTAGFSEFILFTNYKKGKTFAYVHTPLKAASKNLIEWNLKYRCRGLIKIIYPLAMKIYRFLEKIAWKKIDKVIFNSELTLERAKERNLIKNKKTYIVHPPVSLKIPTQKSKVGDYFLYASRFSIQKRQDVLVEVWKKFGKEFPYKLVLAGFPTEGYEKLKEEVKDYPHIILKPNPTEKELAQLYSNALACFFIGIEEDFGISPFEVLAAGKTLIAVNRGGYIDLIKKTPSVVWIKETFDNKTLIEEILKAVKKFLKRKNFYVKRAIRNREFVKKLDLDPKNFAKKIDEILEKM